MYLMLVLVYWLMEPWVERRRPFGFLVDKGIRGFNLASFVVILGQQPHKGTIRVENAPVLYGISTRGPDEAPDFDDPSNVPFVERSWTLAHL